MKKIDKLKFFFKTYKVDLWLFFFFKSSFKSRHSHRYFVMLQRKLIGNSNFYLSKIYKNHKNILRAKYNDTERLKNKILQLHAWAKNFTLNSQIKINNYQNFKNFKVKQEEHSSTKQPTSFYDISFAKRNFTENFSIKNQKIYRKKLFNSRKLNFFNSIVISTNAALLKKRLGTASYELFYADFEGKRFKPKNFSRKKPMSKLKWHTWLNKKIISYYFGFTSVKKYLTFKKKLKKKNFNFRSSAVYILENCILFFLFRLGIFKSFKHIYNIIKYGGVTINKKICKNPYNLVPIYSKVGFSTNYLSFFFLQLLLLKIAHNYYNPAFLPNKFFEIYLPTVSIKKLRDIDNIYFLKNDKLSGVPRSFTWN